MAQAVMQSGTSAGAQVKTTAMRNASDQSIANANRREEARKFNLGYILDNRKADEQERYQGAFNANATRTQDYVEGAVSRGDAEAAGEVKARMLALQNQLNRLDKNDPNHKAKAKFLSDQITSLMNSARDAFNTKGQGRGLANKLVDLHPTALSEFDKRYPVQAAGSGTFSAATGGDIKNRDGTISLPEGTNLSLFGAGSSTSTPTIGSTLNITGGGVDLGGPRTPFVPPVVTPSIPGNPTLDW